MIFWRSKSTAAVIVIESNLSSRINMHLCKEIKNLTPGCGICIISVLVMILNNSGNERLMRAGSLF